MDMKRLPSHDRVIALQDQLDASDVAVLLVTLLVHPLKCACQPVHDLQLVRRGTDLAKTPIVEGQGV